MLTVVVAGSVAVSLGTLAASAIAPAGRIAAAMPSMESSLVEHIDGMSVSKKRTIVRRFYRPQGPGCYYDCHWHGVIKHCVNTCLGSDWRT
jgi:hypothetical protein